MTSATCEVARVGYFYDSKVLGGFRVLGFRVLRFRVLGFRVLRVLGFRVLAL